MIFRREILPTVANTRKERFLMLGKVSKFHSNLLTHTIMNTSTLEELESVREREIERKKKKKEVFNIVSLVKTSYRKGKYLVLIPNQFQRSRSLEIGFRGRKKTTKNLRIFFPGL